MLIIEMLLNYSAMFHKFNISIKGGTLIAVPLFNNQNRNSGKENQRNCRFVNDVLHIGERKKDVFRRLPVEWSHGETVVLSLAESKLFGKVIE